MPENKPGISDSTDRNPSQPGTLRSQVTMEIQTGLAQRLVHGRERGEGVEPIIGVIGFGQRTRALWQAAGDDDPYADWTLLKIEESIHSAKPIVPFRVNRTDSSQPRSGGMTLWI
ncbi:MAG: AcaB family transcriptional regulator, partial [Blastocatellia bacterium]